MSEELSLAAMYRILRKSGGERVSEEAAEELSRILEDIGTRIARDAAQLAVFAKRKTIRAEDVRMAAKRYMSQIPGG
ncbi:MAG: NFYB/HAP3 family transcription factor subunit [Thermoproteota archaeon]|jgi:histone H3/H4|nr:NFYB/HAP3 family transcription factor subunit [Candidatus Brockarchaeota archaeon]NHV98597.1 histone [Nitrososphaerota archaeon]